MGNRNLLPPSSAGAAQTHFNVLILGKICTGKSALFDVLTDSPVGDGKKYRFLDNGLDEDSGRTIAWTRKDPSGLVTFADTRGMTGIEVSDRAFLENYSRYRPSSLKHVRLTAIILCMRFGRLKPVDVAIIRSVLWFMHESSPEQEEEDLRLILVVGGGPLGGDTCMLKELKTAFDACAGKRRHVKIVWLDMTFSENASGRYIAATEQLEDARRLIFDLVTDGLYSA